MLEPSGPEQQLNVVPSHHRGGNRIVLSSDITKVFVYKYKEACIASGFRHAGKSKFYQVWQEVLPHISVPTPSSDLCFTCLAILPGRGIL